MGIKTFFPFPHSYVPLPHPPQGPDAKEWICVSLKRALEFLLHFHFSGCTTLALPGWSGIQALGPQTYPETPSVKGEPTLRQQRSDRPEKTPPRPQHPAPYTTSSPSPRPKTFYSFHPAPPTDPKAKPHLERRLQVRREEGRGREGGPPACASSVPPQAAPGLALLGALRKRAD